MRAARRLLAVAKTPIFLEANTPTGLTGLVTHPAPRPTLEFLYSRTLDALSRLPESSVYRQSTEALTKQRLALVEATKPAGYDEWLERVRALQSEHGEVFKDPQRGFWHEGGRLEEYEFNGKKFVVTRTKEEADERYEEWDGDADSGPYLEGTRSEEERKAMWQKTYQTMVDFPSAPEPENMVKWEPEPPLTADQISELENQIGAGLIEEVIQVAKGELLLLDEIAKQKSWEDLEEKPAPGQWEYFERGTHTGKT
ncbi:MAG: hypothetical protein M1825_001389 [Sarcosagium campestre]|nr:MAG: hypothetical protein M1825_001389 [Sarcosagium campestre]